MSELFKSKHFHASQAVNYKITKFLCRFSDECFLFIYFFPPRNTRILLTWKHLSTSMLICGARGARPVRDLLRSKGLIWNVISNKCIHKHVEQPFTLALPSLSPELQAFGSHFAEGFISADVCTSRSAVFTCCNNWLCEILSPNVHSQSIHQFKLNEQKTEQQSNSQFLM